MAEQQKKKVERPKGDGTTERLRLLLREVFTAEMTTASCRCDEIDDILEENAEEFVKSYVQRGGE